MVTKPQLLKREPITSHESCLVSFLVCLSFKCDAHVLLLLCGNSLWPPDRARMHNEIRVKELSHKRQLKSAPAVVQA